VRSGVSLPAGTTCPLTFSLTYAPPETVSAYERGARTATADAAVDMWALGVIAFELLTGRRAFARGLGRAAIQGQLAGRAPLAWEAPAPGDAELNVGSKSVTAGGRGGPDRPPPRGPRAFRDAPELRALRPSVLACLARDPAARPTAAQLLAMWNGLFDAVAGGGGGGDGGAHTHGAAQGCGGGGQVAARKVAVQPGAGHRRAEDGLTSTSPQPQSPVAGAAVAVVHGTPHA
jgi:Protein kinase domain